MNPEVLAALQAIHAELGNPPSVNLSINSDPTRVTYTYSVHTPQGSEQFSKTVNVQE